MTNKTTKTLGSLIPAGTIVLAGISCKKENPKYSGGIREVKALRRKIEQENQSFEKAYKTTSKNYSPLNTIVNEYNKK